LGEDGGRRGTLRTCVPPNHRHVALQRDLVRTVIPARPPCERSTLNAARSKWVVTSCGVSVRWWQADVETYRANIGRSRHMWRYKYTAEYIVGTVANSSSDPRLNEPFFNSTGCKRAAALRRRAAARHESRTGPALPPFPQRGWLGRGPESVVGRAAAAATVFLAAFGISLVLFRLWERRQQLVGRAFSRAKYSDGDEFKLHVSPPAKLRPIWTGRPGVGGAVGMAGDMSPNHLARRLLRTGDDAL
jgi:hypothetical protein